VPGSNATRVLTGFPFHSPTPAVGTEHLTTAAA
jgi:hypothetical protein